MGLTVIANYAKTKEVFIGTIQKKDLKSGERTP
jgi:hypothetical protein